MNSRAAIEAAKKAAIAKAAEIDQTSVDTLDEESYRHLEDVLQAGLSAALAAEGMALGWQDIATAPTAATDDKDPPVVLLWVVGGGERGQGCEAFGRCYRRHDGSVRGVPSGFHGFKVTHWMPRPAPPETAGKEG